MVKSGVPLASNENQFKMGDPGLFYNYTLLLPQTGNSSETIKELETGLKIEKASPIINYELSYIYLQNKQIQKARE